MLVKSLPLVLVASLVFAQCLYCQVGTKTGSIYGRVLDETKTPLAGVSVQLQSAVIPSQSATTGPSGSFRFANLPPGMYSAIFSMQGFTQVRQDDIQVSVGSSVDLQVTMTKAVIEQVNV